MSEFHHYSELSTWLTCGQKHHYSYQERLEPAQRNLRMDFGTFGHAVLADRWRGLDALPTFHTALDESLAGLLDPSEEPKIRDCADTARKVADRVFKPLSERFEPHEDHIEKTLVVNIPGVAKPFGGTPDAIVKDRRSGALWILDYKFRAAFKAQESEWLNLQMITYTWLAAQHGLEIAGSRQIQIVPALPKKPVLTKAGGMSQADLRTDWETYEAACIEAGLDPAEYAAVMKPKLAGKKFWDFDGCVGLRRPEEIEFHAERTILPAMRQIGQRSVTPIRTYNDMACSWCGYRELCVSEAKGEDAEFVRGSLYQIKGTRATIPVLEEDVFDG